MSTDSLSSLATTDHLIRLQWGNFCAAPGYSLSLLKELTKQTMAIPLLLQSHCYCYGRYILPTLTIQQPPPSDLSPLRKVFTGSPNLPHPMTNLPPPPHLPCCLRDALAVLALWPIMPHTWNYLLQWSCYVPISSHSSNK